MPERPPSSPPDPDLVMVSRIKTKLDARVVLVALQEELSKMQGGVLDAQKARREATEQPEYPWEEQIQDLLRSIAKHKALIEMVKSRMQNLPEE